ncbi:hypothetical protein BIV57_10305 [Mangrovactinospora gilvigrisea]|uniref:GP-PDE domain-containing protein n=2 Tax=Mangrovactinospora gilvigrisea TaxID=1428644 RepID=A0A1J7BG20_9ACTN|nr:hypothetical protein BIV57_10305 [Mangrovactinospora gilvigrisea]
MMIVGHRGAMGVEPENTLRSFRRAEKDGADALELDLHLSADGRLMIMHDAKLDRTTDGTGPLAERTFAELRELDAGQGERIPTFEEVLDATTLPIQAEVKAVRAFPLLAGMVVERDLVHRITITSFHAEVLEAAQRELPEVPRGFIVSKASPEMLDRARELGAAWVCPGFPGLTPELVAECHEAGLLVDAWPGNDEAGVRHAAELGADAVTTNFPADARTWLV